MKLERNDVLEAVQGSMDPMHHKVLDELEVNNQVNKATVNNLLGLVDGYREVEIEVTNADDVKTKILHHLWELNSERLIAYHQLEKCAKTVKTITDDYKIDGQKVVRWYTKKLKGYDVPEEHYKQLIDRITVLMETQAQKYTVCISSRWQDILMMSERCTWGGSCQSLTSTYEDLKNGTVGLALDNYGFIMYTMDDYGRKASRITAYISDTHCITNDRSYGLPHTYLFRKTLEAILKAHKPQMVAYERKYQWIGFNCGYFDGLSEHMLLLDDTRIERIEVGNNGSLCWECGASHFNVTHIHCDNCEVEYGYCEHCDERHPMDNLTMVIGRSGHTMHVCEGCRDEYYRECYESGDYRHIDNMVYIDDASSWVHQDYLDNYFYCEECEEWYHIDGMHEVDDKLYCNDCYEYYKELQEDDEDCSDLEDLIADLEEE